VDKLAENGVKVPPKLFGPIDSPTAVINSQRGRSA
jgi:hypothetical protein